MSTATEERIRPQDETPDQQRERVMREAAECDHKGVVDPPTFYRPGDWRRKDDQPEDAGPVVTAAMLQELDKKNFLREGWRRSWTSELGKLPRPAMPEGFNAPAPQVDELFAPVLAAWKDSPAHVQLQRLRHQLLQVEAEKVRATGALAEAQEAYRQAVQQGGVPLAERVAVDVATAHVNAVVALHQDVSARLPDAEQSVRDDLKARLGEAATAAGEQARQRAEAQRAEISETIGQALVAVIQEGRLRTALLPSAVLERFARELAELT
jgi:hypothetical protein